jgi:hypothetical protein
MKFGFVSMPVAGHLNPMTALARKLQSRGNEVVFIGLPDAEPIVRAANLNFVPFCEKEYPLGSVAKGYAPLAKLHGLDVVEHSARKIHPGRCKSALEHLPEKTAETGVEGLIIDTTHHFVELVPMRLGMPYVHIWNILHIDRSGSSPACLFPWPYETTPEALARNVEGLKKFGGLLAPILAVAKSYAEKNGLQIAAPTVESYSGRPSLSWVEDPAKSVRKPPGSMIVTLMPSGPISLDNDSEKPSTPNFAAAYGARPAGPMRPAMEVTWMMCPALRSRKYGSTALVMMMTPNRLVSICARKSASGVSSTGHT